MRRIDAIIYSEEELEGIPRGVQFGSWESKGFASRFSELLSSKVSVFLRTICQSAHSGFRAIIGLCLMHKISNISFC